MTTIEVNGTFIFTNGKVTFVFDEKSVVFNEISNIDELKAVLIGIASHGTQASLQSILGAAAPGPVAQGPVAPETVASDPLEAARQRIEQVLGDSERAFRDHTLKTQEALRKAEETYAAATSTDLGKFT